VRANAITPPELGGATFTVSSLSDYGIASFTAVINPPQAAILAIGGMQPTPVARDGAVVVHEVMRLTLTCDHRILYGAQAADFLGRIRSLLERPLVLALCHRRSACVSEDTQRTIDAHRGRTVGSA